MIKNSNMSLIHSYQKQKLFLEEPKIVLINFDCSCSTIIDLQESIGLTMSEEDIISLVLNQLIDKTLFQLFLDLALYELFNNFIINDLFINEIFILKNEYKILTIKLIKQLIINDCYNSDKLKYQFAMLINNDTIVLHKPNNHSDFLNAKSNTSSIRTVSFL